MVRCPHEECSSSDKEFDSDANMRRHHTMTHDEQLPNYECPDCGQKFFKENNKKKYCANCSKKRNHKGSNHPNYKGKADYVDDIKKRATCSEEGCDEHRPAALCFHHKPEYGKIDDVSRMAVTAQYGVEDLKREIQKCELICHNCHRERHTDTEPEIENHTIDWDSYRKTDIEINGDTVFRNEKSRRFTLRNCEYCNQEFLSRIVERNRGGGKFHSLRCAGKSRTGGDTDTKSGLVKTLKREGECSSEDCNESRPHCLQFHHIKPENKSESMKQIVESGSMEELKSELKKCKLLCANCHRVKHSS